MKGSAVRFLYMTCFRPVIEYGIDMWYNMVLKEEINKLDVVQNMVVGQILNVSKTTPGLW